MPAKTRAKQKKRAKPEILKKAKGGDPVLRVVVSHNIVNQGVRIFIFHPKKGLIMQGADTPVELNVFARDVPPGTFDG